MSTVLSDAAQLSLAAYANLLSGPTNDQKTGLEAADMASTQATIFATRYPTIVTQYNDLTAAGGMGTGFNATVFMDTAGQRTLAIRGTDDLLGNDRDADSDIGFSGASYDQIVAMVNWWARASAPAGQMINQFRLVELANPQVPVGAVVLRAGSAEGTSYVLDVSPQAVGLGLVAADAVVNVTGHSLGGHLALAFKTLFAGQAGQVAVFNTPGFADNTVNQAFFARLGGTIPPDGPITGVTNVIADEAQIGNQPWNAVAGLRTRPGEAVNIAIENQWQSDESAPPGSLNHSMMVLTDALGVYKLLADLAPDSTEGGSTFTTADYKRVLNQAVQGTAAGYERIVDTLQKLLTGDPALLETGNGKRESLYAAIQGLVTDDARYTSRRGQLAIESTGVAGDFVAKAQGSDARGLAWRYALKELDPFAVIDANNTGVYAKFLPGGANVGELDLYDPASRTGTLTAQWLEDRAALLQRKLDIAAKDENNDASVAPRLNNPNKSWEGDLAYYADLGSGYVVNQGDQRTFRPHIVFGADGPEALQTGKNNDRLYAGGGADLLIGRGGDDYLEGGTGIDLYEYDSARKGLLLSTPDGHDTILDVDGKGVLRYLERDAGGQVQSTAIAGIALREPDGTWKTPDGRFTFERTGTSDLKVSFGAAIEGSVTVRDFDFTKAEQSGFMGLRLAATRVVPQTTGNIIQGDLEPLDNDPATPDIQTTTNELGNIVVTTNAAPDREDTLFGGRPDVTVPPDTAGNSIQAGGGNDIILSDRPNGQADNGLGNADLIDAGAGHGLFWMPNHAKNILKSGAETCIFLHT